MKRLHVNPYIQQLFRMSHLSQGQDEYEFDNKERLAHSKSIFTQRYAYFACIALISIIILSLAYYSNVKYNQTSTMSATIKQHLPIHAGEIHYSRVPHQYWQHRILMIKAMGLNALSVYVMWNFHQIQKGKFDFQAGDKNLAAFLALSKKHNMRVLIRPGPYVCAQWDFGGLPARLLGIKGLEIRSANKLYEDQVKIYFAELAKIIRPFMFANEGPIIMLQIENQLGYYTNSSQHTLNLIKMWKDLSIQSEFYYTDAFQNWKKQYWPDAHIGISGGNSHHYYHHIQISDQRTNQSLIFGGQIYSGWMTHWGQPKWGDRKPIEYYKQLRGLVLYNRFLSMYVAFGGTNFALTAGANGYQPQVQNYFDYMPHITSYDYDAPIDEQGNPTQKYHLIRSVFQEYYGAIQTKIPQPIFSIPIPTFLPQKNSHLFVNLPKAALVSSQLTYFQSDLLKMYNQGIAVYQTNLSEANYTFNLTVHDFAVIYLDQTFITHLMRGHTANHTIKIECKIASCKLKILVQAMGHINYGVNIAKDRKGLLEFKQCNRADLTFLWDIYKIQINEQMFQWSRKSATMQWPLILKGLFIINEVADTFLDMSDYEKGYVWVNNHLLGRYWNIGPQQRLFCPAVWLKKGTNIVYVLQMMHEKNEMIKGYNTLKD